MVFVVHHVLAADHVFQHGGRVLGLGLAFALGGPVGALVAAQQIHQFVEQRHV